MDTLERVKSLSHKIFKEKLLCSIAFNMHDSSVSFAVGNMIVLVLEAERVFRKKRKLCSHEEMEYLIKYGLDLLNKKVEDVKYWSMTTLNNPYLTRLDVIDFKKKEIKSPYWKKIHFFDKERKVLIVNHHLAHAGIYLSTKSQNAVIISCDGGGDWNDSIGLGECIAVYTGIDNSITKHDVSKDHFLSGKIYGACSTFLYNSKFSEGKLMALAGLGTINTTYYDFFKENYITFEAKDYRKIDRILMEKFPELKGSADIQSQNSKDFARSLHEFFIKKRLDDVDTILKRFPENTYLILTGGANLNLDLNTKIYEKYPYMEQFIAPCCDDTGQSLGALFILINTVFRKRPNVKFPYLGEGVESFDYDENTLDRAVNLLLEDGILMVHNGKAEIGPRALGNRSFIARPDSLSVKVKLSEKIKQREPYRPVAPMVLEEKVSEYFTEGPAKSPFMLYRYEVLISKKDKIIGAIHSDQSARAQTVNRDDNPFLYDLIKRFGDKTGIYVLLNTSLNLKGDPIANKIEESVKIYNKIDNPKMLIYNGKIMPS